MSRKLSQISFHVVITFTVGYLWHSPPFWRSSGQTQQEHCPSQPALSPVCRTQRSKEEAISTTLRSVSTHLEGYDTYKRMLFIDISLTIDTKFPTKLIGKLLTHSAPDISTPPLKCSSLEHPRVVCSAHSCSHCTHMTVTPNKERTPNVDHSTIIGQISSQWELMSGGQQHLWQNGARITTTLHQQNQRAVCWL